jgi:peptidyl-prolyl cis-trans isomerase C
MISLKNIINFHILIGIVLFLSTQNSLSNENWIVSQGEILVTFDDIDGFAQRIPEEKRKGFFESPERIDKTIYNILTMKHVVKYGFDNHLVSYKEIENEVSVDMLEEGKIDTNIFAPIDSEEYINFKNYLINEESYKLILNSIKNSVDKKDLEELAMEDYLVNKNKYYSQATRNIDYLSIAYDETNKEEIQNVSKNTLSEIIENKISIQEYSNKEKSLNEIKYYLGINDFYYNTKFKQFSDFIFDTTNDVGIINQILDADDRFIIVEITKINQEGIKSFEEVKEEIVERLAKSQAERRVKELVADLTKDKVDINHSNLISIKSRY